MAAHLHEKDHGIMAIVEMTALSCPALRRIIDLHEAVG
jgi:hypothetical protein